MCIQRETREKARQSLAFSPVSKPHTHILVGKCCHCRINDNINTSRVNSSLFLYKIFNYKTWYIEEGQTTQWPKEKRQRTYTYWYNHVSSYSKCFEKHKIYIYQNQKHKSLLSLLNSNIYQMVDVIKVGE
jgi:hypothetical protein